MARCVGQMRDVESLSVFDKIDPYDINKKLYHVGKLGNDIIQLLNLQIPETDIYLHRKSIAHIKAHDVDFASASGTSIYIAQIPDILENPDYVSLHPDGKSIRYIKRYSDIITVAVSLTIANGGLRVKTLFPITNAKLQGYIDSGNAKAL